MEYTWLCAIVLLKEYLVLMPTWSFNVHVWGMNLSCWTDYSVNPPWWHDWLRAYPLLSGHRVIFVRVQKQKVLTCSLQSLKKYCMWPTIQCKSLYLFHISMLSSTALETSGSTYSLASLTMNVVHWGYNSMRRFLVLSWLTAVSHDSNGPYLRGNLSYPTGHT